MTNRSIIGLCGAMGAGKDTVADILSATHGYINLKFADELRAECCHALAAGAVPEDAPQDIREIISRGAPVDVYVKPTPPDARRLLQWWGTEYRRSRDNYYWTGKLRQRVLSSTYLRIVVTDVRYANEAAMLRELGAHIGLIRRTQPESIDNSNNHESEKFCNSNWPWDFIIDNNESLAELGIKVNLLTNAILLDVTHGLPNTADNQPR